VRSDAQKPTSVTDKCSFCIHRVSRGLAPACVASCTARAMIFGDLNDAESEISLVLHESKDASVLRPEMGTLPQVYYLGLNQGGVADPIACYQDRSDALREDFNAFKRNNAGQQFGDIEEGQGKTTAFGFTRQLAGHLKDFTVEIFERLKIITRH
jgi:tetrathionate reductase subunit B